jgi:hypothetical protein
MLDFTTLPRRNKSYAGANGSKIAVVYEGDLYMLKFPGAARLNQDLSYANGCISEYLGSHVFELAGIPAQKTLLGTYTLNGKEKIVVACKDFTATGLVLQDFTSMKNTVLDSDSNGTGTELNDITEAIETQTMIDPAVLSRHFWDMFIVDALIGNWDRHNGNWGFLYNTVTDEVRLAPIFDCGSCLFPQADESIMRAVLDDPAEKELRIFERPLSAIRQDGQKINYFDFISSLKHPACNAALKRIAPKLRQQDLRELVDGTPFISDLQKEFYRTMLFERKERILDYALDKLLTREKKQSKNAR